MVHREEKMDGSSYNAGFLTFDISCLDFSTMSALILSSKEDRGFLLAIPRAGCRQQAAGVARRVLAAWGSVLLCKRRHGEEEEGDEGVKKERLSCLCAARIINYTRTARAAHAFDHRPK